MSRYQLDPLADPRWKTLVERHPRASVFHSPSWLRAIAETYKYEPVAYTTTLPDAPLQNGLVFCRVQSFLTGKRLVSLPFSDHCEPFAESETEMNELLAAPLEELIRGKWKYIELRPLTLEYSQGREKYEESYFLHRIDLSPSVEDLYKNLHLNSIRRRIRRAERERLILESGVSNELLANFYGLHVITRKRQRLPPHPLNWFRHVLHFMGNDARISVAKKNGRAIAAILPLQYQRKVVYKYGCSDARFHNVGGMQFLLWNMILDGKQKGFEEIDLGRSQSSNMGLVTFKDRWGSRRERMVYVRYPPRQTNSNNQSRIMKLGKRIIAHCPNLL